MKYWFAYLIQQLAAAASVLCAVLALSEILLPGSVLPYFNLHALIIATFILCLISPAISKPSWWIRLLILLPVSCSLLAVSFLLLWSGGFASNIVFIAFVGLMIVVVVALCRPEQSEGPNSEIIVITDPSLSPLERGEQIVEVIEIEEETSVFMR